MSQASYWDAPTRGETSLPSAPRSGAAALGCSRARVVRQLLTESVLFALCGGAVGVLMAHWSLRTLVSMMPGYIRRIDHIALDGQVLAASLVLATVTGLLFGVLPAISATRVAPEAALKTSAPLAAPSRRRMRGALIVGEVGLSLALLIGAGLLIKTFLHMRPVDPGFDPKDKLAATISLPSSGYADGPARAAFVENLRRRLLLRPGVQAVIAASYLPLSGHVNSAEVRHEGMAPSRSVTVDTPHVTANYFSEMRIRILRGRAFTALDGPGAGVAIVNETMAKRMWPGRDPLGRELVFAAMNGVSTKTIVGVSRDVRDTGYRLASSAELYVPFADEPSPVVRIVVKTLQGAEETAPIIRAEVAAIDPLLPVGDVESLAAMAAESVAEWRFGAVLLGAFAGIAASLAAVGLFAVVGSWVIERTPEIGVRMALGAGRGAVVWLFLARALLLTGLGMSGGLLLAALTTRFLEAWLVDASPLDPPTFVIATVAMGAVSVLATLLAARRAASVDPLVALRS
ncbi:MAG: FtsX-like permease family protein [Vicinamibacteraceae bacterium]